MAIGFSDSETFSWQALDIGSARCVPDVSRRYQYYRNNKIRYLLLLNFILFPSVDHKVEVV